MPYVLRHYLYLFGSVIFVVVAADWLSPLELTDNAMLTLVGAFLGIVVGQCVFGRKNL
jgi:hypothetical protein